MIRLELSELDQLEDDKIYAYKFNTEGNPIRWGTGSALKLQLPLEHKSNEEIQNFIMWNGLGVKGLDKEV